MKAITVTLNTILLLSLVVVASIFVYIIMSSILASVSASSGYHIEYNVFGDIEKTSLADSVNILIDIRCMGDCENLYVSEVSIRPVDRYTGSTITTLSRLLYFPLVNNTAHIELTIYSPSLQNVTDLLVSFKLCKENTCTLYYATVQVK